ncbi:arginine deiminase-related protein [Nannocystis bainbridge]|uniref:Arginine deiminase-related protein n=1 Tax=Nannocystis bainbridge TaxID=2995303 RepID=A0ABT5ED24_9BACT|nr:arginine deiminase-related protein [Nannocystis bainbridge]MDC0723305.1 arginine deiminase-related protein [Nannocystis bainbridge]
MIVTSPADFLAALPEQIEARGAWGKPTMSAALVVSPIGFRISPEPTDNAYMQSGEIDPERAFAQHHGLVRALGACGLPVLVVPGRDGLDDAVFPNNAFATIPDRLIVGSMRHPVRRAEAARDDVRDLFTWTFGHALTDLSQKPGVSELTGPLVIDRRRGIGLCGLSQRADELGCAAMHAAFGLRLTFRFALQPDEYHTNVVLAVLAGRACVVHPGSFADPEVPAAIARAYEGRTLELDDAEKQAFAANCIAVGERDLLLSATAHRALRPASRAALEGWDFRLHPVEVDEFEKAGGSLRCMIAEIF